MFPVFWFGFLTLWTVLAALFSGKGDLPIFVLFLPAGMAVFGYFLMRWLVFPLADEVFLDDGEVIVRKNGREVRFPVRQIMNVDSSMMTNPERITLTLREPTELGREIVFSPTFRFHLFSATLSPKN